MKIIELQTVESTNVYAKKFISENKDIEETLIFSYKQTKGRGLGRNTWHTEDGKNIIFSLIVFPEIRIEDHFMISMNVSLAVCEYICSKGLIASIKWPNDIYIGNKKICGTLIENVFYGDIIKQSIVGAGLNLNQTNFPDAVPNPVSISLLTGKEYDIRTEVKEISNIILEKINNLKTISFEELRERYLSIMYQYDRFCEYRTGDNVFSGKIINVKKSGHLVIEDKSGKLSEFYFKEIEYILKEK